LVLAGLGLGTIMVQFVHNPAVRFELTQTHKSIGITILALTVLRLCRRLFSRAPKPEPAARSLLLAAKAPHIALYALLVLMPVSGWFMATTTPVRVPTVVFGLFALPYPMAPDLAIYRAAHAAHVVLAILLSLLIVPRLSTHWSGATRHSRACGTPQAVFTEALADRSRGSALLKPAEFLRVYEL
jgi:cytochrome b561